MIYSTNYYDAEPLREQASPVTVLTELTHPIPGNDPRVSDISWWGYTGPGDPFHGRVACAWWTFHPELAVPGADITVMIGGNFTIRVPDLLERCIAELGDDDILVMRHPWRDDIEDEANASLANWKWNDGRQDLFGQVRSYFEAGHPRHWGLFHGGLIVRRDTPAVRAFNEAWREEYRRWSSQSQLSLPFVLRTMDVRWHAWADVGQWHAQPFEEGWVQWGDLGRDHPTGTVADCARCGRPTYRSPLCYGCVVVAA